MEHPLTARETQVMKLVAEGENADGIGLLLGIHPTTVKTHMAHIRQKLRVHSMTSAVFVCLKEGYIT